MYVINAIIIDSLWLLPLLIFIPRQVAMIKCLEYDKKYFYYTLYSVLLYNYIYYIATIMYSIIHYIIYILTISEKFLYICIKENQIFYVSMSFNDCIFFIELTSSFTVYEDVSLKYE